MGSVSNLIFRVEHIRPPILVCFVLRRALLLTSLVLLVYVCVCVCVCVCKCVHVCSICTYTCVLHIYL